MTPNPNVRPYICYIFPKEPDEDDLLAIITRRKMIVMNFYRESEKCCLLEHDRELLARFNALVYLTAHVLAEAKEAGHEVKNSWDLFGWGVQEHLNIIMLDGENAPE